MSQHNPDRSVTVSDVAREAGVSKATAARALGEYGAVSEQVRSRVLAAAEALGWRPNELARSMSSGRSRTVAVVVGDVQNSYFGHAVRGVSDVLRAAGYEVLLSNTDEDPRVEAEAVRHLLDKQADGFVVAPASGSDVEHLREITRCQRPLVLLDRRAPGLDVDVVQSDMRTAGRRAGELLLAHGHRSVGYVSTLSHSSDRLDPAGPLPDESSVGDRLEGLLGAFADAGVPTPERHVRFNGGSGEDLERVTRDLLGGDDRPTAIVASDGVIAISVLRAVRSLGLRVPDDVSVLAFDDAEWTDLVEPSVTAVKQSADELGREAGRRLIARLAGDETPPRVLSYPAELMVRRSVGEAPGTAGRSADDTAAQDESLRPL